MQVCRRPAHSHAAFRAFGEAHRDRHESCVGCLRRGGQVERIGRSAAICLACPGARTSMVGWAPRAKPARRRPACSSTGPRLRRYGQVSTQQGRAPLDRPLRAPINLKPMHHAFRGDDGHCVRLRHISAWANRSWPVSAGPHRTAKHQFLAGARAYEEAVFASGGRSRVRPWVAEADSFTGRRHMLAHLERCDECLNFATYSPGDPTSDAGRDRGPSHPLAVAGLRLVVDAVHRLVGIAAAVLGNTVAALCCTNTGQHLILVRHFPCARRLSVTKDVALTAE